VFTFEFAFLKEALSHESNMIAMSGDNIMLLQ